MGSRPGSPPRPAVPRRGGSAPQRRGSASPAHPVGGGACAPGPGNFPALPTWCGGGRPLAAAIGAGGPAPLPAAVPALRCRRLHRAGAPPPAPPPGPRSARHGTARLGSARHGSARHGLTMIVCPQSVEHPRGSRCQRLPGQVVKMSSSDPECPQFLFVKVLASRGRLEAVTQQMGYHPQYLDSFLKTQHYLMHMDGPLPFDCRHYIAIMAAARHQCRYLVNLHVLQFLRAGGDPQWLRGLEFIPPKLRNLNEINKILAHRPWLITKEHIEKLLKISEWSWSLAELVHAVVLLAHCHALASFVFGCGCEQDEGLGGRGAPKPLSLGNQCFCEATAGNSYSQELLRINRKRSLDSCMELDSLRERMQRIHVETEGRDEMRLLQQEREEDTDGEVTGATNLACYMQDPDFGYQDFARRDEDQTQVFRVQDYSWEDHGFSLVNRLYSDIGHLLDEKFRMVDGLQSSAMAKRQGCEPSVFKRGIWNYIHCMFGIRYDDYDYAEVNQLLERMLKVYIKTVTCYPEKTNSEMFDRFWKQFKHSEKVHVNLLILEARMQAELLYALQAITQYMIS
ncbi:sestrin-3-like isoform X2 [Motacilla alba alba]|uniref:sestrin-3-like isoform X2 n=1 Tax=Motacilla alba alba TaxID=1094192 RepID=UPI0018D56029|nr:sestrin-3-like isoform X2 [Motacilla alba alba]